jgi:cob(I)alamin adenosyltransferase
MRNQGHVRVYTGDGKGKTTSALGFGFGAVAQGLKVFMIQFLKRPRTSGEHFLAQPLSSLFTIKPMGRGGFIKRRQCEPEDRVQGQLALEEARDAMLSGEYGVIILDEANVAVYKGVIDLDQLLEFIRSRPQDVDLVITGRNARPEVIELADIVVEVEKVKHHFDKGWRARKGIDF